MTGVGDAVQEQPVDAPRRRDTWAAFLTLGVIALVVTLFAGLLPMASWRPDEYHDFGLFRSRGWSFFFERLLTWSPRPLSEAIAGLYHLAILETGRQLIAPFLAALWATLLIGPALSIGRTPRGKMLTHTVLGGAVLCFFLLGHQVSEVFFWPMGSVAYLPMLAAISALTFQVLDGRWQRGGGRWSCIVCVLCAAGSAEMGAIFAIFFAASMIGLHLAGMAGRRRDAWAWIWPLSLGLVVMAMLALGRGQLEEHVTFRGMSSNPALLHHPLASVARSFPTYFRQLAALDAADAGARSLVIGAAFKAAMAIGLAMLLLYRDNATGRETRKVILALALSLQATFFVSIAGSYYKFGMLCCERHDTIRQCFLVLTVLCGAAMATTIWSRRRRPSLVGVGLIGLTLLLLLVHERSALRGAYAARDRTMYAQQANWASGHSPGPEMTFLMPPLPPIVNGMMPPARGEYRLGEKNFWLWDLVLTYFAKQELRVEPL